MEAYELTEVVSAPQPASATPRSWIQSARFDLTFFTLSPLIALPVLIVAPEGYSVLALVMGALLGAPHYLSTFVFFFWDETRSLHRARWAVFFGGPALIVSALALAAFLHVPYIIQVVVYVWNAVHVARQSCGILSIYRHRAGVKDPELKSIVNGAVMSTSLAMAFWNIAWYPTLHRFMQTLWTGLPQTVAVLTAAAAAVALVRLGVSLAHRVRSPNPPRVPELAFLMTSLLLFHPYLWIEDANRATLGMLLGHFVQYLGIVWLVHRRKFSAMANPSRTWLARLSTSLPLLILAILTAGGLFLALQIFSDRGKLLQTMYEGGYLSLALVHFYLDGLFWAFKRREVRENVGPYLMTVGSMSVDRRAAGGGSASAYADARIVRSDE
jgi:hypothetical protein